MTKKAASRNLQSISWLQLIEITPSRFLLVIPSGTAIEALELALVDLIGHLPEDDIAERNLLTDLRQKLCRNRRKAGLSKGEILFVHSILLICLHKTFFSDYLSTAVAFL